MAEPTRYTFDEAILGVIKERQRREQEAERLRQETQFNDRQLSLLQQYRDQQTQLDRAKTIADVSGDYAPSDYAPNLPSQSGGLLNQRFGLPAFQEDQNYIRKDLIPEQSKPQEQFIKSERGGGLISDYYGYDPNTITDIKRRNDPGYTNPNDLKDKNGGGKTQDISNEAGDFAQLLKLYDRFQKGDTSVDYVDKSGNTISLNKDTWRTAIAKPLEDAMTKTGVPMSSDIVNGIRQNAGINEGDSPQTKREKLKTAIYEVKRQGAIRDDQYQALLMWAEAGTR